MSCTAAVRWQDGGMGLGYFEQFPDYLSQGEWLSELEENLRDLYRELHTEKFPVSVLSPNLL